MRAEATETKTKTTQRSASRLNVIAEDSDFSEATEEVDNESEEDSTPYSRGGRQIQGGHVLHLPHKGTHCYRLPGQEKQDEQQNKEAPARKVKLESAARGKLQGEVSPPKATHDETKTARQKKYETRYLKRRTMRPVFRSKDFSDLMMNEEYFLKHF
jgi:hypothetical protein